MEPDFFSISPQAHVLPGMQTPAALALFDDPAASRAELAALLLAPAPRRQLALTPPRIVLHPQLELDDLLAAAAIPGSLGAALLENAGVLLRLVEVRYAAAAVRNDQQAFVAALAPVIGHDSLLHLMLHTSPAIRSFTRDVVRWRVQVRGDEEGLRSVLRHAGDFGLLMPADSLEGAVLGLTAPADMEEIEGEDGGEGWMAFISSRTGLVWVVDRAGRAAHSEQRRVTLAGDWWHFRQAAAAQDGLAEIAVRIRRQGAGAQAAEGAALPVALPLGLLRLTEPWELEAGAAPPADPAWRRMAGEGVAALIKCGAAGAAS